MLKLFAANFYQGYLNVLQNYFDDPIKLSDLYLVKVLYSS